jgi:methionyl-tRNA synthetase
MVAADQEGKSYREVASFYNEAHREDFRRLGLTYDCFTRTTTRNHERVTQDLFKTLYEHGAIIERTQLVSFSPTTGHTLPDRYIEGTCPICGYGEARGDQCDNCGNQLDPVELIDPRSRIDGSTPEFRETNHLFLDLPKFADALRGYISGHGEWRPNVRNFSLGLLEEIRPRPITRDLDWGVRIPIEGYADDPNKRIYV